MIAEIRVHNGSSVYLLVVFFYQKESFNNRLSLDAKTI